jgi:hypothetical protein
MPDRLIIDQDIDAIPTGPALDMAVQQAVMPGNIDFGQLDNGACSISRDRTAPYSTNMPAAWQVVLMVRGWVFYERQKFLGELQLEVLKAAGGYVSEYELLANMRPEHVCRAALKAARFR